VPEHVRSFTSVDVLAVEHEIVDRLATRAEAKTITVIEGAAGAGKTARLAATRERAIAAGHRMVVVTPTLKAAQVAEGAIGAASYSAAWLLHQHGFRWDEDGRWSRGDSVPDVSAQLRRGDLLVVDEAGMVDQDTARALLRLADETQALVMLVGDRHQLPAVGRGGVLDLTIRYAPDRVQQLDGVRRFKDPRYAELSVRMRTGTAPGEVFDELLAHGEIVIHGSDVERTRRLAAEASVGKLVVADTREQVGRINAFAHRIRKATGEVDEQVLTAAGERIGVGDTIATRRNDRDADVANRELWTVVSCERGALTVRGEAGTRVLPPDYVRRDVELAYATTAYGAQGTTVTESHVLVGEHSGAASAYVGMTRGLERNVALLVAESVDDACKQWCDVFGRDRADLGPAHAREAAAEAIERYGPKAPRLRAAPRLPAEFDSRPAALPSAPGIGF
jgi:ATP-dependent exoDNAse (exonuclease V) alpha subunit